MLQSCPGLERILAVHCLGGLLSCLSWAGVGTRASWLPVPLIKHCLPPLLPCSYVPACRGHAHQHWPGAQVGWRLCRGSSATAGPWLAFCCCALHLARRSLRRLSHRLAEGAEGGSLCPALRVAASALPRVLFQVDVDAPDHERHPLFAAAPFQGKPVELAGCL